MTVVVSKAAYGKDNVRILRVERDPNNRSKHTVYEQRVQVLLSGDIDTSFTEADNSVVVPTDTVKNTIYILSKKNSVNPPEAFAAILTRHFLEKYSHIHGIKVFITQYKWTRLVIDGRPHAHSFIRDGPELRVVESFGARNQPMQIRSGVKDLLVLKSSGSGFVNFHECDATTLKPDSDRILSTEFEIYWDWKPMSYSEVISAGEGLFNKTYNLAIETTLRIFAVDYSASVQATMYDISKVLLNNVSQIQHVSLALPNKHYFQIDLSFFHGLKNTGPDVEVYSPQTDPNGLITATFSREKARL